MDEDDFDYNMGSADENEVGRSTNIADEDEIATNTDENVSSTDTTDKSRESYTLGVQLL